MTIDPKNFIGQNIVPSTVLVSLPPPPPANISLLIEIPSSSPRTSSPTCSIEYRNPNKFYVAAHIIAARSGLLSVISRYEIIANTSGILFAGTSATGASGRTESPAARISSTGWCQSLAASYRNQLKN